MARTTLGLIVGNRDVFPAELARAGREEMLTVLAAAGIDVVAVSPREAPDGVIMTWNDAQACARLFHESSGRIDGILVTLPNFGDERAIADSIRLSGLRVPVYVHAFPDAPGQLSITQRRDSFCGKLSVCNVLKQYGVPFSVGADHVLDPRSPAFRGELAWFTDVCRVVRGLRGARLGLLGERTVPFKTVRFSEKLLEASGISVESWSLTDAVAQIEKLSDSDATVQEKLKALRAYLPGLQTVPERALATSAKLGVVIERWMEDQKLNAYALQCWSAMQGALKIFPCATMSLMGNGLHPAACEADVMGALAMYALQLAGGTPTALLDWNNNNGDDPDELILFHCSNTPTSLMKEVKPGFNAMAVKSSPQDSCYCTLHGSLVPGRVGYARLSTDDEQGRITGYVGDGEITAQTLDTFGTTGVLRVPGLQRLMRFLVDNGFEHHVAMSRSPRSAALYEAFTKYLGWKIYLHNGADGGVARAAAGLR